MTVDYYDKAFGFTGREGLALMGVHGVAEYFSMFSRNDYDWIRQEILTSNSYIYLAWCKKLLCLNYIPGVPKTLLIIFNLLKTKLVTFKGWEVVEQQVLPTDGWTPSSCVWKLHWYSGWPGCSCGSQCYAKYQAWLHLEGTEPMVQWQQDWSPQVSNNVINVRSDITRTIGHTWCPKKWWHVI